MAKLIVYDFDGTIADSMQVAIDAYNGLAEEKGFVRITKDNLAGLRAKSPREILKALDVSLYQVPSLLYRVLRELKKATAHLEIHIGMEALLPKVHDLGYRQAILTTNLEESVRGFLQNHHIDVIDFVYCGSSAFGKATLLKKLMRETGFTPQDVIYVGDEVRDIEAAKKANVSIVCVDWGYNTREILEWNGPQAVVSRADEILAFVQTK